MNFDPYILTFSVVTVVATLGLGFWAARRSKTAHDFFVAGRSVSVGWNASAISGEYLSAASFMGVAGMVMSSGYDALWYPVGYACGYLFLLLFIAGPLRRFGAYTIPDFAEGRFDSPLFRKIAVIFVLFIGFFYTMPQMKGAGTTLAYIFPGLPYWAGVVLVGAVITVNVALGGMKGITLVQAFQYWLKLFAISVPVCVLMAVYGHYGKQLGFNGEISEADRFVAALEAKPELADRFLPTVFVLDHRTPAGRQALEAMAAAGLSTNQINESGLVAQWLRLRYRLAPPRPPSWRTTLPAGLTNLTSIALHPVALLLVYESASGTRLFRDANLESLAPLQIDFHFSTNLTDEQMAAQAARAIDQAGIRLIHVPPQTVFALSKTEAESILRRSQSSLPRAALPAQAPADATWLSPFGPLTTKAARVAAAALTNDAPFLGRLPLRPDLPSDTYMTVNLGETNLPQALATYGELTGRIPLPRGESPLARVDDLLGGRLSQWGLVTRRRPPPSGVFYHRDGLVSAIEVKDALEAVFRRQGRVAVPVGEKYFRLVQVRERDDRPESAAEAVQRDWLDRYEKPLALLYTYSLIIALVCGTAGLPHILVRFYTNPDGVAAKRTTMWVMVLIGVFYLFPPIFGVMGRNLAPELYAGAGAKGTDKVVLELPKVLDARPVVAASTGQESSGQSGQGRSTPDSAAATPATDGAKGIPWGSILSGITCAGAFAAFMSTFSGLLVSMTGALAHDVYGRMLRPRSTPEQRLRAFKLAAIVVGGLATLLGTFVEPLQINFMVGQAFAIAAASYFPLLFVSCWWRGLTMKGAATGMLAGGIASVIAVTLTNFSDLQWVPLGAFWAAHPLLRILCEQPALWAVPLAIGLMIGVSRRTAREVPADVRMKMLVLHAPEKLGLKQEYIQEHPSGH